MIALFGTNIGQRPGTRQRLGISRHFLLKMDRKSMGWRKDDWKQQRKGEDEAAALFFPETACQLHPNYTIKNYALAKETLRIDQIFYQRHEKRLPNCAKVFSKFCHPSPPRYIFYGTSRKKKEKNPDRWKIPIHQWSFCSSPSTQ